jgi:hypothetical protein
MQLVYDHIIDYHASHRLISVGAQSAMGHNSDRGAKIHGFNPAIFRPLTLVPIK